MKTLIEQVDKKLQAQNLITLQRAKKQISVSDSGFYWIYTKLFLNQFIKSTRPLNNVHIDFSQRAKLHEGLKSVITQSKKDYWCIYNGKGKQLKVRLSSGFTNTSGATGKLALIRCFKEDDFRIKFIICQSNNLTYGITEKYDDVQRDLERVWRLHYGWPFLCCK